MSDEYKPHTPKFVCPDCGIKVAIEYPAHDQYCVDCESPLAEVSNR